MLVLALLAGGATLATFNYDDRKAVADSAPSSVGYAALERHFPISQSIPQYVLVQSPHDLRTPQALADLEQMASRIAQLPDVARVMGVTRPLGEVPPEFRATFQAGIVGDRLAAGSAQIGERSGDLNELADGANTLADTLDDVRAQVDEIAPMMDRMVAEWLEGDADGLAELMNEGLTDPVLAKTLLYDRNARWAEWVETRLEEPGTVFLAVGAGHLAGEQSLQDFLEDGGLNVIRVQ